MTDNGIHLEHANLSVRNLTRALAFYRALFPEWVVRWEGPAEEGRWVHFGPEGEGQPGYLSLYEDPGAEEGESEPARLGIQHIGFSHPDVDALIERVLVAGIQPTERKDDGRYRRAYFDDPDGHNMEFVQKLRAA